MENGLESPNAQRRPHGRWIIAIRPEGGTQVDSVRMTVVDHDDRQIIAERVIDSNNYEDLDLMLYRPIRANGLPAAVAIERGSGSLSEDLRWYFGRQGVELWYMWTSKSRPQPDPIDLEWPRKSRPYPLW
jgi:hypothetical protein